MDLGMARWVMGWDFRRVSASSFTKCRPRLALEFEGPG
jgi:hypothetical protein